MVSSYFHQVASTNVVNLDTLGPITREENPEANVDQADAMKFLAVPPPESQTQGMDIDDLVTDYFLLDFLKLICVCLNFSSMTCRRRARWERKSCLRITILFFVSKYKIF
jgi:hypothetical protein